MLLFSTIATVQGHFLCKKEIGIMEERNIQKARRRKRLRQKRRARLVVALLFLCIVAASFAGGFLTGCSWRKDLEGQMAAGSSELYTEPMSDRGDNEDGENERADDRFDPQWNLLLVNRWHPVPDDYEVDLVEVEGGERVDRRIYEPLTAMLEDARKANWDQLPFVVSGYRTTEKQQRLYDEKITEYKQQGYSDSEAEELA